MDSKEKPAVIVGAGIGGLSAAVLLAARGYPVIVVEKANAAGGKMREIQTASGPVDSGPTVFTMRRVFEDIFRQAGTDLSAHVALEPVSILARHAWNDTERLDLFADIDQSVDAISQFANPDEGKRYRDFCNEARCIYQSLEQSFILASRPSPLDLTMRIGVTNIKQLLQLNPFVNLWKALAKHFHDPRLQQLFGRYSTYMGSSPYLAPATLMLIAHVEQDGVWLVKGGMYRLVEAMTKLAEQLGVRFEYGNAVKNIGIDNNRIHSITLENETSINTNKIIFNGELTALANGLLGEAVTHVAKPTLPSKRSLSAMTWSLSAKTRGFPLLRHNVFFSNNYASEFQNIFREQRLPQTPTVYVCAQDRNETNAEQILEHERLLCLVNAPAIGDSHTFTDKEKQQCQNNAFKLMASCGLDVTFTECDDTITTPTTFNQLFPATGGALYGRASHGWLASFQRPGSRTRIEGLYLAGGSVHPGAGVPMAATSGRLAAEALLEDAGA